MKRSGLSSYKKYKNGDWAFFRKIVKAVISVTLRYITRLVFNKATVQFLIWKYSEFRTTFFCWYISGHLFIIIRYYVTERN